MIIISIIIILNIFVWMKFISILIGSV